MHLLLRRASMLVAFAGVAIPVAADTQSVQPNGASLFSPDRAPEIVIKVGVRRLVLVPHHSSGASDIVVVSAATLDKQNNTSLSKVIEANVAGAAASSSGQFHIRGSHGQYTYYLDGAPLPESISGSFSNLIDPKNIETLRVYTGGFPAKYGDNLAAVFDVTAKAGNVGRPIGTFSQSGGGFETYETTLQLGGGVGNFTYFLSAVSGSTDRQLDPVTPDPIHDSGSDQALFGKFDLITGHSQKLVLDTGYTEGRYQIPTTEQQQTQVNPSTEQPDPVHDTQQDGGSFGNLIWISNSPRSTSAVALYTHNSVLKFNGSPGDLVGPATPSSPLVSTFENRTSTYYGLRIDETNQVDRRNNVGYGVDASTLMGHEEFLLLSTTDGVTIQSAAEDQNISGNDRSAYIQDDWTPGRWLINYGLRGDIHKEVITTSQISPRLNTAYTVGRNDKVHFYYDRLFQPAAVEDVRSLAGAAAIPVQPERDDFYETGWEHDQHGTTYGIAYYYKTEKNVIDDTVVGNSFLTAPFNVVRGYARGVELTTDGTIGSDISYYINYARSWAKSDGAISGGLFSIGQPPSWFYDDHDQTNTATVGVDYEHKERFVDLNGEYGSGFPYGQDAAGNVNFIRVEPHFILDADFGAKVHRNTITLTVTNLLNHHYIIKQASQFTDLEYGQGRTFAVKWAMSY